MNAPTVELTEREGYDLFHRAIVGRDGQAWAVIYTRYRSLLLSWAYRSMSKVEIGELGDDIADEAFARAWSALTPERFGQFPTLASLLAYLRTCVLATVIDAFRSQALHQRRVSRLEISTAVTPEQIVMGDLERAELWQIVNMVAETAQERTVLVESFVHDLPPRAIQARYPDLFHDAGEIYRIKRLLIERLQRNRNLWRFRQARELD